MIPQEPIMPDTVAFLAAVVCIVILTIGLTSIAAMLHPPRETECRVSFSDGGGNRHEFVGRGQIYPPLL
jgi:hypothetical protein